jgi:23S rRNA (guanine2445-N2)-methyltransferase / 23S rRNA (guanine2069-N7)-methyltransferase
LTAYPRFEETIGKQADRRRKLYNGRLECTYYQFHGPHPRAHSKPQDDKKESLDVTPVFGGISQKAREQAELFASRLRKRAHHLRRWPTRRGITCFRLYEKDIPEIPLVVDRYEDHLHIVEFERPHERDLAQHADWLQLMSDTAAKVLEVDKRKVFLKSRQRQRGSTQHEKLAEAHCEVIVREADLKFIVNLSDYADTGLFLDHRISRGKIRELAAGKRVLNLFAYTGAFSVYAAAGGASETVTVDWSANYLAWAQRNFQLNGFSGPNHNFHREDASIFVANLTPHDRFDLIVLDPPTFSNSKRTEETWDVQRDHGPLLQELITRLTPGGTIFFSTNFRRFKLDESKLENLQVYEISRQTVPEDYRNRRVHRSWLISPK